ncbi:MAG TPA: CBS domain-containing protein [Pyrinomonadaceae bacterium]|nr:CBS domain-containing protein [Pyrinomonadaceae bacterium]
MSRYRFDRDDDFYYGGRGEAPRRGYEDDRYDAPPRRVREVRGGGASDYYDDERTREVRGYGGGGGGGRTEERDIFGGSSRYGGDVYGSRAYDDERTQVRRPRRRYEDDDDRDEGRGRSVLEEGREYVRRAFGGRGRGGPSRSHVRCRDIMTRDVTVATRETTLDMVARMMRDEDTGVIPVVERASESLTDLAETERPDLNRTGANVVGIGKLVGLITDRDIVVRAVADGKDPRAVRAEEVMTSEVHTAQPNDRVIEAIRKMGDKQVRRIPIVDRDGTLRGIISMADVALETEDDHELAEALEEISSGTSFWNRVFG